jgi:aerobic-type carbon monoxide dehydrogenase small subunit (CoxS/CutS family)
MKELTATAIRPVTLSINGETVETSASLHDTLLTVLRERLQLTAAKRGCNQGVCGACTVLVAGKPVRACLSLAQDCEGAEVQTLEGLNDTERMQVLQSAFSESGAFQCGFCTPGMLVGANALLEHDPQPDESAIRSAMSGNLCRCTGYVSIIDAVKSAALSLQQRSGS